MVSDMKTIPLRAGFLAARSKGEKALARGLVIQAVTRDSDDWRIGLTATKKTAMPSRVIGHGGVCALWREIICRHWQKMALIMG